MEIDDKFIEDRSLSMVYAYNHRSFTQVVDIRSLGEWKTLSNLK